MIDLGTISKMLLSKTYIQAMRKNPNESFHEYTMKWRVEDVRARPPVKEQQMNEYFVKAQEPQYLDKLITVTAKSISETI